MAASRIYFPRQVKKSESSKFRVFISNSSDDSAKTGMLYTDATIYYAKASGAAIQKVIQASEWAEIGNNMQGWYDIIFSASDLNTLGQFIFRITGTGINMVEVGGIEVTDAHLSDLARILGLSHHNWKELSVVYDAVNPQRKLSSTIKLYPTAADVDTDTNAFASYTFTATYGNDGLPSGFSFKKVT